MYNIYKIKRVKLYICVANKVIQGKINEKYLSTYKVVYFFILHIKKKIN